MKDPGMSIPQIYIISLVIDLQEKEKRFKLLLISSKQNVHVSVLLAMYNIFDIYKSTITNYLIIWQAAEE